MYRQIWKTQTGHFIGNLVLLSMRREYEPLVPTIYFTKFGQGSIIGKEATILDCTCCKARHIPWPKLARNIYKMI
jgi:hypothetical protein